MSNKTIKNRQFRIDPMVSKFFTLLFIVGIGTLGFKYYTHEPPPKVGFTILGDEHKEDEMLKFRNDTPGEHDYQWDFGDSTIVIKDVSPLHIYDEAGSYIVKLVVDGEFEYSRTILIEKKKVQGPKHIVPKIAGPTKVFVGKPADFTCSVKGGKSWAWSMGESGKTDAWGKTVRYTFSKPGYRTVALVVDGNRKFIAKHQVYVKMEPETPLKPFAPAEGISAGNDDFIPQSPATYKLFDEIKKQNSELRYLPPDEELSEKLLKIMKGEGDRAEFEAYLCGTPTDLIIKSNGHLVSFEALMKDVEGEDIVLKELSTIRKNSSCIIKLTVRYRKRRNILKL